MGINGLFAVDFHVPRPLYHRNFNIRVLGVALGIEIADDSVRSEYLHKF